jgi:hypothetical protein
MNSKALLYLLITLVIGFALGMITGRALQTIGKNRMHNLPPVRNLMDDIIVTLDLEPEQVDSIRPVFDDFFERAETTRSLLMKQAEADMDTLRLNLLPYLTEYQIKKIEELGLFRPGPRRPMGPPGMDRREGPPPHREWRPHERSRPGDRPPEPPEPDEED